MNYYVEIVKMGTAAKREEVVKRMGPMNERKADLCERGAYRNLNHDLYYTRVVTDDEDWKE